MAEIFTSQFWRDQWTFVMSAPWIIIQVFWLPAQSVGE